MLDSMHFDLSTEAYAGKEITAKSNFSEILIEKSSSEISDRILNQTNERECRIRHGIFDGEPVKSRIWQWNEEIVTKGGGRNVVVVYRPNLKLFYGWSKHFGKDVVFATTEFWSRAYNPFSTAPHWFINIYDERENFLFGLSGMVVGGCPWKDTEFKECRTVTSDGLTPKQIFESAYLGGVGITASDFNFC